MNPSIPVIGSTAVGIRSKTIEINKNNKNLFGTYLKLLHAFFGLFGIYCNLLLNIYLILASVENLLEFRNLFGRLYKSWVILLNQYITINLHQNCIKILIILFYGILHLYVSFSKIVQLGSIEVA